MLGVEHSLWLSSCPLGISLSIPLSRLQPPVNDADTASIQKHRPERVRSRLGAIDLKGFSAVMEKQKVCS
jgi:hypothetical protein